MKSLKNLFITLIYLRIQIVSLLQDFNYQVNYHGLDQIIYINLAILFCTQLFVGFEGADKYLEKIES